MFQIVKRSKREREGDDAIEILCWNCSCGYILLIELIKIRGEINLIKNKKKCKI